MATKRTTRSAPAPGEGLVSVTLARPHTHAGEQHPAGATLYDVHPGDAALMRQFGVLAPDAEAASPTIATDDEAPAEPPSVDDLDADSSAPAPCGGA